MPQAIYRSDQVMTLLQNQATLLEVLPRKQYEQAHLPRAVNIPLAELNVQSVASLTKERPAIVYCYDFQ